MNNKLELNSSWEIRDRIIFGNEAKNLEYSGGAESFYNLKLSHLKQLIELKFIDLADKAQPYSPSVKEFFDWGNSLTATHVECFEDLYTLTFSGYAVENKRSDYRVSITGFEIESNSMCGFDASVIKDIFIFAGNNQDDVCPGTSNINNEFINVIWT